MSVGHTDSTFLPFILPTSYPFYFSSFLPFFFSNFNLFYLSTFFLNETFFQPFCHLSFQLILFSTLYPVYLSSFLPSYLLSFLFFILSTFHPGRLLAGWSERRFEGHYHGWSLSVGLTRENNSIDFFMSENFNSISLSVRLSSYHVCRSLGHLFISKIITKCFEKSSAIIKKAWSRLYITEPRTKRKSIASGV